MPEDPVRKRRKRDEGQGCLITLLAGAGGVVALLVTAAEGIGRLV